MLYDSSYIFYFLIIYFFWKVKKFPVIESILYFSSVYFRLLSVFLPFPSRQPDINPYP